jgi:hypothetical protein
MAATIEVHFIYSHTLAEVTANVSPQCTGQEVIEELVAVGTLIPPLPLGQSHGLFLRRTGELIKPDQTFEAAGVENGDTIEVVTQAWGAGPDWAELGHMLFWSLAAASVFIKAAKPVLLEFLKNKRSRSIIIRTGKSEIILSGDDPEKALEILKLIENKSINDTIAGETSNPSQDLTIQLILRDVEGRDSE